MDHQRLTDTLNQLLAQAPRPSTPRPSAFRPNFRPQGPQGPARLVPPYGPNLPQSPSPQYLNGVRLGPHLLKREPQPEQPVLPIFSEKKIPYHELLLQPVRPLDKQPPPPQEVPQHFTLPLDGVPKRRVKRKPSQIPREPITINPDQPDPAPKRPDVAPKINRPPMQPPKNNIMQPIGHNGDKVFRIVEDKHKSHLHQSMDMMRTNGQLTDVVIMVNSEQFHAHKIMLCAGSLYFKKHILESRLPHGSMDNGSMIFICIDKVNGRQLTQLLDYIYKGEIQVSESELPSLLQAARELQIVGLCEDNKSEILPIPMEHRNGHRIREDPPKENGVHHPSEGGERSLNGAPQVERASRPPSGGSSNSSNASSSQKTGSSRKKGNPKRLIPLNGAPDVHRITPPESPSSSNSLYAQSSNNESPENQRSTPTSLKSNEPSETPMDYSRPKDNDEERPLIIAETPEPKRSRSNDPIIPTSTPVLPETTMAGQILQSMRQNWAAAGGNPFSMMLNEHQNRTSSESSGVDHDSERDENNRPMLNRLSHPSLPGINPQDMIQKLHAALGQNAAGAMAAAAAAGFPPGGFGATPWASTSTNAAIVNPALMNSMAGMSSMAGLPSMSSQHQSLGGLNRSPPQDQNGSPSTSRGGGIPAGVGANGKPAVSCEICGKTLADPSSLYRHRKIHNGEKPHKCPFCGRRFIQRYNMTQHIKTHFKSRGINSLANNPATLAAFLNQNRSTLSNYQIPEDMINSLATNQEGFVTEDMDTNRYEDELNGSSANLTNHSLASEHDNTKDESQEEIDPYIASDIETPETVVPQNDDEREQQPSPRPTLPPFDTFLNPMNHT